MSAEALEIGVPFMFGAIARAPSQRNIFPRIFLQYLKRENIRAKEELTRIKAVPLVIGQFSEMVDENYGIVTSTAGSCYYGEHGKR